MKSREKSESQKQWDRKVELLEQGVSPDGLPINPLRKVVSRLYDKGGKVLPLPFAVREHVEGHFSYVYQFVENGKLKDPQKGWYTVKKR